ncbi:RNA-binding KH domain-containing protein RCF3-like isoform X2 [Mercurialis annua]|uniref:RNA-binding KH domain-containing protein RCF3-like isoform X2 n=1 Tax=Mercurialis annua TaxID=3986 RepID=UPI002160D4EB|nr:RNA-binding KH domain-containing protein RCF3-like isoform X2 [Mercurialis annua]
MGSNFLSPPAKRPIQYPTTTAGTGMFDPNPAANGLSNKRPKQPPNTVTTLPIPVGHVSFRVLCHASRIGGIIGKSGNIIKQLQQQTGAKIRVEEAPAESPDRVITIIGQSLIGGEADVSKAQEGLIRVFERILEVAAESDGINVSGSVVSCRLLAEAKQMGSVIGKGGKIIETIRKDCGVKIRVLTDKMPVCALPSEEMVEIEGNVLSVKKALIVVSRCLQDSQPVDKPRMTGSKSLQAVPQESLHVMPVEILPQRSTILPTMPSSTISYAPVAHHLSLESNRVSSLDTKLLKQEVVFKILCSNDMVGGVIGKGGAIIQALKNETGASITIGSAIADCEERLITVSASENPESQFSAAQKAAVLVFSRFVEAGNEKGLNTSSGRGFPFVARFAVPSSQVGCLLGKGGIIISEMRKTTSTGITILGGDQIPKCVPENEQVVQISGDFRNVKDAVYHVTGRLRDYLFSCTLNTPVTRSTSVVTEASPYGGLREPLRDAIREPVRDAIREPWRDTITEPVRDILREPWRDTLREPWRDTIREPVRDTLREPWRDTIREPIRDTLSEPWRDTIREPIRDTLREPWRDTLREPWRDTIREPWRDTVREPWRDTVREPWRGTVREPIRDTIREPIGDTLREPSGDALRETLGDATTDPFRVSRMETLTRDSLGEALRDPLKDTLRNPLRDTLNEPLRGAGPYNLHSPAGVSHSQNQHSTITNNMDHLGLSHSIGHPISPRSWASQTMSGRNSRIIPDTNRGLGPYKGSVELGTNSGSKAAIVTNTTVEIRVPENVIGSVYGQNGSNLTRMRQLLGFANSGQLKVETF